jgi:hypothetical protein
MTVPYLAPPAFILEVENKDTEDPNKGIEEINNIPAPKILIFIIIRYVVPDMKHMSQSNNYHERGEYAFCYKKS